MRRARSYSIVDHELYHGGYLHRLSHEAMALYLFLVVVGDCDGKSFYGEATLREILRLDAARFLAARSALVGEGLIDLRKPYWWVRSLSGLPAAPPEPRSVAKRPSQGSAAASQIQEPAPAAGELVDREAAQCRLREIVTALASCKPAGKSPERS